MLKPNQKRIDKGMWWDRAWSLVEGCTPVSPACKNCWSAKATEMRFHQNNKKIKARYAGLTHEDNRWTGKIRLMHDDLQKPTPRQKPAVWAVWNDLFHEDVPWNFQYKAFERMLLCPQHFFIVCTKRPEIMVKKMPDIWFHLGRNYTGLGSRDYLRLKNVMAMTTVENQEQADIRIPHLLRADFAWRGLSVEPMLEKININPLLLQYYRKSGLWIVAGPETGPKARPCPDGAIQNLYRRCREAWVPFFDKSKKPLAREFPG